MDLFRKIWTKNFLKAKEPIEKFSEDIGGLKGEFSWIKYKNGQKVDSFTYHNAITELSKSTVIRLLSQGTSAWNGVIDPTQYKISKMRFGNAPYDDYNNADELKLHYYDLSESVNRNNLTNPTAAEYSPAGGRYLDGGNSTPSGVINSGFNSSLSLTKDSTFFDNWGPNGLIIINITSAAFSTTENPVKLSEKRPPSHKTFLVELLDITDTTIASLGFNTIYSRDTTGNLPTNINIGSNYLSSSASDHKLYYDYTAGIWKIQFKLGTGSISTVKKVRISFKTGLYNIANSIVPKTGYNAGSGEAVDRFPLSSGIDYYSISNLSYYDSIGSSFVDDYKVTFSVPMAQIEGNGSSGSPVYYTEAFLFNARDDLFSIIRFPYPSRQGISSVGFSKDSTVAYFISWTIKSLT